MTTRSTHMPRWIEGIFRAIAAISRCITRPSVKVAPEQRRRIRLLAAFLILMALNTLAGAVSLKNIGGNSLTVMLVTSAVLLAGYFVSRTRYYQAALIIAIIIPAVPSLAIAVFNTPEINLTIELMWLGLPLLLSSLMFSVRQTITLAFSYIAFIIILELRGSLGFDVLAPLMAYILIITFVGAAVAVIRRIDQTELKNNLTERLQVEKSLRESEEKFRNLFEYAKDAIVLADAQTGIIIDVNPAATKLLGLPKDKMVGKHQSILHPAEKAEQYKQVFLDHVEKGLVLSEDILLQRADGTLITADVSASVFQLGGHPVIQGVFRDITERKQMEEALANEAIWRRILIKESRDGIVILDQNGKVYEANRQYAAMLGYSPEEISQLHVWDWDTQWAPEKLLDMIKTVDEAGDHFETCQRHKDGTVVDVELSTNGATFAGQKLVFCVCRNITERKRMESALRESEEKFSKAFHASPDAISISTLSDGTFLEVNESYTRITGYTREELISSSASNFNMWANDAQQERMLRKIRDGVKIHDEEFDFYAKSGELHTMLLSTEYVQIGGQPCLLVVSSDITERKKMEDLQKTENYVLTLLGKGEELDRLLDAIVRLCEQNDPAIKGSIMLYDSAKNWLTGSGPSLSDEYNAVLKMGIPAAPNVGSCGTAAYRKQRVVVSDIKNSPLFKPHKGAVELATKHGLLACWSEPIISSGGDLLGTIANYCDHLGEPNADDLRVLEWSARIAAIAIERKRIEKSLRESEEKFSKAFNASPEIIAITTKDGIYVDVNDSYTILSGYSREELIGHTAMSLNIWADKDDRAKLVKIFQEQGKARNEEFAFRVKSGEIRTWMFSSEPITIGEEPCLLGVSLDITERKQAEIKLKEAMVNLERSTAQLKATNKELESFSYSVSHDLRSPLRSIDGFSQALLEDYAAKLDETGQDYLNRLRNASQKMGELIDGLLKLSRLARSEMHLEKVDLSALAEDISTRLKETHPNRKGKFIINSGLNVEGDPQMLRVLLENLFGNAWKFTRKTPHTIIEFGSTGDGADKTFFVKDNGAGFDMAYKDKLFGAFQRLHDSTDFPGTGIGLATVQRIINRHGGKIRAEGAVGKGATFYFTLS